MPTIINKNDIANYINFQAQPTAWHTVTQAQINKFADCTLDHQFIHVDEEKAKQTLFGSTIAHGFYRCLCYLILLKILVSLLMAFIWG